ncbi:MAG: hypothetical protein HOV70_23715 [Streptomyces sp.]|nr:hypothetical protein [Streptomyces sp.]
MTPIPDDIASDICEDSLITCPTGWPKYEDRDGEVWWLTEYSHDGDRVMLPAPGDCPLMLRRDAEAIYGPLKPTA